MLCAGEVLVWDLSQEDDLLLATSGIGDDAHREPVTRVHWMRDTSSKKKRYNVRDTVQEVQFKSCNVRDMM